MLANFCGLIGCVPPGVDAHRQNNNENSSSSSAPNSRVVFPVPLKSVSIRADVRGFATAITAQLTYENSLDTPIECQLVIPLDESEAVYKVEVEVSGRKIRSECRSRESAIEVYSTAVDSSYNGTLLDNHTSPVDAVRVWFGYMKPKSVVVVTIGIVKSLGREPAGGIFSLTVPSLFCPRYVPDLDAGTYSDLRQLIGAPHSSRSSSFLAVSTVLYSMSFDARINLGLASRISGVTASSSVDNLDVKYTENNKQAIVTLVEPYSPDHPLQLLITSAEPNKPVIHFEAGLTAKPDGCKWLSFHAAGAWFEPQGHVSPCKNSQDTFWFLVDRSETMDGQRIEQAKAALLLFIKSLPVGSKFNVVSFGTTFSALFKKRSVPYLEQNISAVVKLATAMKADFGSSRSLLEPLKFVYGKRRKSAKSRGKNELVFLLTDGETSGINEVLALAAKNASSTRIFTVGIGTSACTTLVDGLARVSGGVASYVLEPNERISDKVMSLLKFALNPAAENVKFEWQFSGSQRVARLMPDRCQSRAYEGCPIVQFALVENQLGDSVDGSSTIVANVSGSEEPLSYQNKFVCPPTALSSSDDQLPVHRLAAVSRLTELSNDALTAGLVIEPLRKEAIAISVATGLVCDFTAVIAVDAETGAPLKRSSPIFAIPESKINYYVDDDGVAYHFGRERSTVVTGNPGDRVKHALSFAVFACNCGSNPNEDDYCHISNNGKGTVECLVIAQRMNGSWRMVPKFFARFFGSTDVGSNANDVRQKCVACFEKVKPTVAFAMTDDFLATALALAILRHQFSSQRHEVELIDQKAAAFLFSSPAKAASDEFTASQLTQFISAAIAQFRL